MQKGCRKKPQKYTSKNRCWLPFWPSKTSQNLKNPTPERPKVDFEVILGPILASFFLPLFWHGFLIDFDVFFVRYSNHVAFNFHSILDRLRDAFCNRIRYSFKLLPFGVHRTIIPVNSDSMKTTAVRSTANGQPPFHSSLSYCGLDLSVSSKDVEIDFFNFGTDCASILQPNTTCLSLIHI